MAKKMSIAEVVKVLAERLFNEETQPTEVAVSASTSTDGNGTVFHTGRKYYRVEGRTPKDVRAVIYVYPEDGMTLISYKPSFPLQNGSMRIDLLNEDLTAERLNAMIDRNLERQVALADEESKRTGDYVGSKKYKAIAL